MTEFAADEFALPAPAPTARPATGFARHERDRGAATATLLVLNVLMLVALAAVLWSPAVIFWAALALAPTALLAIVAITLGWWM